MVSSRSHMLRDKTRHLHRDASAAWLIIEWLNRMRGTEEHRRIGKLLKIAVDLELLSRTCEFPKVSLLTWRPTGTKKQFSNVRRAARLTKNLKGLLTNYTFHPKLLTSSRGRIHFGWTSFPSMIGPLLNVRIGGDLFSFGEPDVLLRIVEVARRGSLGRIRRCANCSAWYFANVRHQGYCRRECQQRNFRKSRKFKTKRKFYMRIYRRREHERNKRAELAGRIKR